MNVISRFLAQNKLMILDGALATELESKGLDLNDTLWSAKVLAEQPQFIEQVHYEYFLAGADIATTASYQASVEGFMKKGYTEEEACRYITDSVKIAVRARDRFWADEKNRIGRPRPLIAGSVGPYGAYLADGSEYRGDYKIAEADLAAFHRSRIRLLVEAGVDFLACETIPCLWEAQVIAKVVGEFPDLCCWISFSCSSPDAVCDGTSAKVCAAAMDVYPQVAAIGINCTPPQYIPALLDEMGAATQKPLAVYPNSGEVYDPVTKTWHGTGEAGAFAAASRLWHQHGARLIGGCCRTTPAHIEQVLDWVSQLR